MPSRRTGTSSGVRRYASGFARLTRSRLVAVLTNCDDDLFALTQERIGIPFDAVITAQQVRSYKPALAHFQRFAQNIQDHDVWVHAARAGFTTSHPLGQFGITRIWIDRERTGKGLGGHGRAAGPARAPGACQRVNLALKDRRMACSRATIGAWPSPRPASNPRLCLPRRSNGRAENGGSCPVCSNSGAATKIAAWWNRL